MRGTAAKARIALNQCIRNHDACVNNCFLSIQHRPPYPAYFKDCTNRCDANHSACVDFALTLSRNVQRSWQGADLTVPIHLSP